MLNVNKKIPRLFLDMDGTIAEWRNIIIELSEEEQCEENAFKTKLDSLLYSPDYFYNQVPQLNVIAAIRTLIKKNLAEVYILSCTPEDKDEISPLNQKNRYLDKFLPEIDYKHRIFVYGTNKNIYVPNGIQTGDYLLDDYTKNLISFESTKQGQGIKLLNKVNSSNNTWKGSKISYSANPQKIVESLCEIMYLDKYISHPQPQKDKNGIKIEDFLNVQNIEEDRDIL